MKGFNFRLQTPFNVVTWKEKMVKEELREKQMVYDHQVEILDGNMRSLKEISDQDRELNGSQISVDTMILLREYQGVLSSRIRMQQEVVDEALEVLEETRGRLTETMKEKKAMEKLKDRQYQRFNEERLRQDQNLIDEVAVIGYSRTRQS